MQQTVQLRFLLLQVITPHLHREDALSSMRELELLVHTFGGTVVEKDIQHRVHPHPSMYIGSGKVEELKQKVKDKKIDVVVLNSIVKSGQLFRLEKELWEVNTRIQVWDRVGMILHIFDQHANTRQAKLQIELARIKHEGPRVYGLGKTALSRQGGGIGTRGAGETNIEQEKRVIKQRTQQIQRELSRLGKQKHERIRFRNELGIGPVALVGYTSAGKTTLFNVLTGKDKTTHAGLFTTLDTVVGKMKTPDSRLPVLISDTIGFIEDLPPLLIDAFQSTLIESLEAKLLLHVVDASDPFVKKKITEVEKILDEMEARQPRLLVFNKCDLLSHAQREQLDNTFIHRPHVMVSAISKEGIPELKEIIVQRLV